MVDAVGSRALSHYYGQCKTYYYYLLNRLTTCATGIDRVFEGLYLSDLRMSLCDTELDRIGITHIITAIIGVPESYPQKYTYKTIPLLDTANEDILSQFSDSNAFIHDALQSGGKVLVHCMVGASRSATIAAAYIISQTGHPPETVIDCMKRNRAVVQPNPGFMESLEYFYLTTATKNE